MNTSRLGLNKVKLLKNLSSYISKRIWKRLTGIRFERESYIIQSILMRQFALMRQSALKDFFWISNWELVCYNTPPLHTSNTINESALGRTPVETDLIIYCRYSEMLLCILFITLMWQSFLNLMPDSILK